MRRLPYSTNTFERKVRLSATTDGLLRRTQRLARILHGWTADGLLSDAIVRARRALIDTAKARGLDWQAMERADYSPDNPMPELPAPDASPIDDVGPRE